jgi:tRNA (guanine-N7-)-methyltransferase
MRKKFLRVKESSVVFGAEPQIDWRQLFENSNPIEIEVGSGKGAFLLSSAEAKPDTNFVGIEKQPRWIRFIEERLRRNPLANVRIVCADAAIVIARFIPDRSVRAYHVYFPDPWWKTRHHKRRVVSSELGIELLRTLEPDGVIHLATDVEARFRAMLEELAMLPVTIRETAGLTGRPLTNFERKYAQQGRRLFYATIEISRRDQPPASGGKILNS